MNVTTLCRSMRFFRKLSGYTQEDLGKLLNIKRQTYANYENGRRLPNIDVLFTLAEIYGITIDTLVNPLHSLETANHDPHATAIIQMILNYDYLSEDELREVKEYYSQINSR